MKMLLPLSIFILLLTSCKRDFAFLKTDAAKQNTDAIEKQENALAAGGTIIALYGDPYPYGESLKYVFALDAVTGKEKWKITLAYSAGTDGGPCVANNRVYVLVQNGLLAYDLNTGATAFRTRLRIEGEPQTWPCFADGKLFVAKGTDMYRIDPDNGQIIWSYFTKDPFNNFLNSPTYSNGKIYDNDASFTYAFDAETGTVLLKDSILSDKQGRHSISSQSSVALKNGVLYFAPKDSGLIAVDTAGNRLSSFPFDYCDGRSSPCINKNQIFVHSTLGNLSGSLYGTDVYAINLINGKQNWRYSEMSNNTAAAPGGDVFCTDEFVFVPRVDSLVALKTSNGKQVWAFGGATNFSAPAAVANYVFVGTSSGLCALNASTGRLLWKYSYAAGYKSGPVILTNTGVTVYPVASGMTQ